MENAIIKYCQIYNCYYEKINSPSCLENVYQLLINDIIYDKNTTEPLWFYYLEMHKRNIVNYNLLKRFEINSDSLFRCFERA